MAVACGREFQLLGRVDFRALILQLIIIGWFKCEFILQWNRVCFWMDEKCRYIYTIIVCNNKPCNAFITLYNDKKRYKKRYAKYL